jgi:TRAP-type mannitol/chloroaromatic compound transport system permease large subunit
VRGGLAYAVIFVGALLAATTGVVAASVISMGLISLPIMLRYGYDRRFASGVIAASGTLAQIIPPSLVLIIMADQLGKSVGDMYAGAFIPGISLACLYALYTLGVCTVKPAWAPALPLEARTLREPSGAGGTRSLLVLTIIAAGSAIDSRTGNTVPTTRPTKCWSATSVGTGVAFLPRQIRIQLGLLSRSRARRVRDDPPLALIFWCWAQSSGVAAPTEGARWVPRRADHGVGAGACRVLIPGDGHDGRCRRSSCSSCSARVFSLTFYGVNGHLGRAAAAAAPSGQLGFLIVTTC